MPQLTWENFMDIATLIFGLANIFLVYLVYGYTRRDINPKLSVIPSNEPAFVFVTDYDYDDWSFTYDSFDNIHQNNQRVSKMDFDQQGFPYNEVSHNPRDWKIKLKNYNDLPALNVKMEYSIIIKKAVFDSEDFMMNGTKPSMKHFQTIKSTVTFVYIPAQSEVLESVLTLKGEFLEADLIIHSLKSDERIFIKKPITIDVYKHPSLGFLEDSHHELQLFGVGKPIKEI